MNRVAFHGIILWEVEFAEGSRTITEYNFPLGLERVQLIPM